MRTNEHQPSLSGDPFNRDQLNDRNEASNVLECQAWLLRDHPGRATGRSETRYQLVDGTGRFLRRGR